jgi:hypothetical protein
MTKLIDTLKQERTRAYLYRVLSGAGLVALGYGLLSAEEVALWTGLVGTIFALPAVNTSTQRRPYDEPHR